jgi:hypothetical protein
MNDLNLKQATAEMFTQQQHHAFAGALKLLKEAFPDGVLVMAVRHVSGTAQCQTAAAVNDGDLENLIHTLKEIRAARPECGCDKEKGFSA